MRNTYFMIRRVRRGFACMVVILAFAFSFIVLGDCMVDLYKVLRCHRIEGVVSRSAILESRNKRGTCMYSLDCKVDYFIDGIRYSTDRVLPMGNIKSNSRMLVDWNYGHLLSAKTVVVCYDPRKRSEGFVFHIGKAAYAVIAICIGLGVISVLAIRRLFVR